MAVCSFDLAVNRSFTTKGGERREEVCFITVVVWDKQAQSCAEFLSKGRQALVEGRLHQRSWETPDGQKRSKHEVIAERVQFVGGRKDAAVSDEEPPLSPHALSGDRSGEEEVPF
jgi:single-strand DNA-binding protein